MKKVFSVDKDFINARLDRWIKKKIFVLPQSIIEKSLRKGLIKINGKKEKSSYKLKLQDQVTLHNFKFNPNVNKKKIFLYKPSKKEISSTSSIFIENNENFVVINKPPGVSVQSGTKSKKNIIDILRDTKEFNELSPFTVHRIDKETSGILIVAKNRKYAQFFTSLFRLRKIQKTYLCISLGVPDKNNGTYTDMLQHYDGEKKITSKGITHFKVLDTNNNYTLFKLNPQTGRKHQLRKQLLIHGHPILGDTKYRFIDKKNIRKSNLMLHAYKISFFINNIKYNFTANPPEYFITALKEKYLKIF